MSANVAALAPLHRVMGTHATDYRLGCGASGVRAYGALPPEQVTCALPGCDGARPGAAARVRSKRRRR